MISEIAEKYNLDPQLVKIVIEVESGFNPNACSPQNAMGLMQIIPETARSLNLENPYDPYENIKAGVRYLRLQLDRFGCIELALAAYNAGPGAVEKYGGIPPYEETQNYVRTIMERYYNGESD
jgi:soluble lytic murein transglycosylase-like protein